MFNSVGKIRTISIIPFQRRIEKKNSALGDFEENQDVESSSLLMVTRDKLVHTFEARAVCNCFFF